jgi:hypothetical protein
MFDQWDDDKLDEIEEQALDKDYRDGLVKDASEHREHLRKHATPDVIAIICDMITAGRREEAVAVLAKECGFTAPATPTFDVVIAPGQNFAYSARTDHTEIVALNKNPHSIRLCGFIKHKER